MKIDPSHNHTPSDPRVFVFGSNLLGIHGAGAARYAADRLGATAGVGEGFTGFNGVDPRAYALPTCSVPGMGLPLDVLQEHIERFIRVARKFPNTRFFVSAVGCGHAGYDEATIAPLFMGAPSNCDLPPGWRR